MSGHAIPAVLCGNQCAALCDAEPTEDEILHGGQTVIIFDLLELLDFCAYRFPFWLLAEMVKGIDHPDSIPVKDG